MKKIRMTSSLKFAVFGLAICLASWASAQEDSSGTTARKSREEVRAAFESCASSLGIEKPAEGQRPARLDDATREKMDACLLAQGIERPQRGHGHGGPRGERPAERDSAEAVTGVQQKINLF